MNVFTRLRCRMTGHSWIRVPQPPPGQTVPTQPRMHADESAQPRSGSASLISVRERVAASTLGVAILAALAAATTGCSRSHTPEASGPSEGPAPSSSASTSAIPRRALTPLPRCRADDVGLSVAQTGSVASQPFSDIALTNTGTTPCALSGYPRIEARGVLGSRATTVPLAIAVHHGLYERTDPGPHRIALRPRHDAFFSIGTATAYQGGLHPITLRRLTVVLPGTQLRNLLSINLLSSRPVRGKIPVGITAVTASPHS